MVKIKEKTARVEFVASPDFVRAANRAAVQLDLNLSAYIRVAVSEKMERDARRRNSVKIGDDD